MQYVKEILEKEIDVYNNYLEAAVKKKQALIDNDIELLEDITVTEKDLSTKILALEAARIEFLREKGYSANIHLNDLLEEVPSEDKDSLEATAKDLREILSELKKFFFLTKCCFITNIKYILRMLNIE